MPRLIQTSLTRSVVLLVPITFMVYWCDVCCTSSDHRLECIVFRFKKWEHKNNSIVDRQRCSSQPPGQGEQLADWCLQSSLFCILFSEWVDRLWYCWVKRTPSSQWGAETTYHSGNKDWNNWGEFVWHVFIINNNVGIVVNRIQCMIQFNARK